MFMIKPFQPLYYVKELFYSEYLLEDLINVTTEQANYKQGACKLDRVLFSTLWL